MQTKYPSIVEIGIEINFFSKDLVLAIQMKNAMLSRLSNFCLVLDYFHKKVLRKFINNNALT